MRKIADIGQDNLRLGPLGDKLIRWGLGAGLIAIAASLGAAAVTPGGFRRWFFAYLVNFSFFLTIAVGGLFFVIVQHLTRAGWSVVVRRLAEGFAATLPILGLLFLPVLFGVHEIYHWGHADNLAHDALLQWKAPYLNVPFFTIRWVIYFLVWGLSSWYFLRLSKDQDRTGDPQLTRKMGRVAAFTVIPFALSLTFGAFDLLMSLDPHWISSVFGVYFFSGSAVAIMAVMALAALGLQRTGRIVHSVTVDHFQDVGKLLFAFTVFWAYIAFSQFMLIWYANLPEETSWYLRRQQGGWGILAVALIFGHFFIPFFGLISRPAKRNRKVLGFFAMWLLVMHYIDLYWVAMPEFRPDSGAIPFSPSGPLLFLGLGGLFLAAVAWRLKNCDLVPRQDPRLPESLAFENV